MRFDLLLLLLISVLVANGLVPSGWTGGASAVRILGIAASISSASRHPGDWPLVGSTQALGQCGECRSRMGRHPRAHLDRNRPPGRLERKLLRLQVATVWQLNFQLRNFWHRDLRTFQDQLLQDLKLPSNTSLGSSGLARRVDR